MVKLGVRIHLKAVCHMIASEDTNVNLNEASTYLFEITRRYLANIVRHKVLY